MDTNFIIHEPANEYHARSRSGEFMSSHLLVDFRESPALYRKEISGEIEGKESAAFIMGRAAHSLILEGRSAFDREYVVSDGPVNPRTGESYGRNTKAFAEWAAKQEREVVSGKDFNFLLKLQRSVWLHPAAEELLAAGEAEGVVRAEYCGVPCQIRMDWFSPESGLVDLKTCDSLKWFESDCRRFGYIFQMAFYRAVIRIVTGVTVPIHIIAVEKNEPFATGVWQLTGEVLDLAERINDAALERYKKCQFTGIWPTGYEDIRIIDSL
ncbi:PD-(D/E)XK nuclease-like domain-containing protein [bacterium]|nr:PD-(D/E)XK nuclease-like domain-containing protein [bacterium]